jgi:hypothetical protein
MFALRAERILTLLRNLTNISQNVAKKQIFNFRDIENILFFNKNPESTVYPFSHKTLKKISVTFEVSFLNKEDSDLKFVFSRIKKVNNREVSKEEREGIILVLAPFLIAHFFDKLKIWQNYIIENIKEFCDTEVSIINWKTLQSCGVSSIFNKELTFFQKLWININASNDRAFWLKTATDIRESLLPWLNNELWTKIEKNRMSKRENVDYDEQKKAMVEGVIENLDKISQNMDKEDLDIIE